MTRIPLHAQLSIRLSSSLSIYSNELTTCIRDHHETELARTPQREWRIYRCRRLPRAARTVYDACHGQLRDSRRRSGPGNERCTREAVGAADVLPGRDADSTAQRVAHLKWLARAPHHTPLEAFLADP